MRLIITSRNLNNKVKPNVISVHLNDLINCSRLYLISLSILNSWYNITELNNEIVVNGNPLFISPGSYDIEQIVAELNSMLQADVYAPEQRISVSFRDQTFQLTLSSPDVFTINWKNLGYTLGFSNNKDYSSLPAEDVAAPEQRTEIHNEKQIDVSNGQRSILISTNLTCNTFLNGNYSSVLTRIPITAPFGNIIHFNPTMMSYWVDVYRPVQTLELTFKLNTGLEIDVLNNITEIDLLLETYTPENIPRPMPMPESAEDENDAEATD